MRWPEIHQLLGVMLEEQREKELMPELARLIKQAGWKIKRVEGPGPKTHLRFETKNPHGTLRRYRHGCRCHPCRTAMAIDTSERLFTKDRETA